MSEYKLIAARTVKGIKQQELAKQLGISPQYLRLIEIGKAEPRRDLMIKIAEAFYFKHTKISSVMSPFVPLDIKIMS